MRKWLALPLCLSLTLFASCELPSVQQDASAQQSAANISYDENDYYSDWTSSDYQSVTLGSDTVTADGVSAFDGRLVISAAGTYVIGGSTANSGITVEAGKDDIVQLVLNGAQIHSEGEPAIHIKSAGKTIITAASGTNNVLSDSESYNYDESDTDAPTATLFSKDDLTINGGGTLTVNAACNDAITSKDDLKILGTTIVINAADDAIIGRDSVCIKYGSFTINAAGDGIKSTNDEDTQKGFVAIEDGVFSITAGADGIQAQTDLLIYGGQFEITSGGGSELAAAKRPADMGGMGMGGGNMQQRPDMTRQGSAPTGNMPPRLENGTVPQAPSNGMHGAVDSDLPNDTASGASDDSSASGKGLKASNLLSISGGQLTIDSLDDAIHSDNSAAISGGVIYIKAGDDAVHADMTLTIGGGTLTAEKCYEGLESANITINNGTVDITASDDGINATEGTSAAQTDAAQTGGHGGMVRGNAILTINGGSVYINAQGDGLDANGSIYQNGGLVVVNGPTNGGNGALDYDGEFPVNGGTLIAAGSSQMNMTPSASGQNSISMTFSQSRQANSVVCITDESGRVIAAFAPKNSYQSIVFSSADIQEGKTYTISTDGAVSEDNTAGFSTNASQTGNAVVSITASSGVTYVNESGITTGGSSMGGAMRGQGGKGNMRGGQTPPAQNQQ